MFEHLEGWDIFVHYQFKKFTWSTQKLVDQRSQEQLPGHARHSLYLQFLIFLTKWTANTKFLREEFLLKYTYSSRLVHTLQCKFTSKCEATSGSCLASWSGALHPIDNWQSLQHIYIYISKWKRKCHQWDSATFNPLESFGLNRWCEQILLLNGTLRRWLPPFLLRHCRAVP